MAEKTMTVEGYGGQALLWEVLKQVGIEQGKRDKILVHPALIGWQSKAPTKKRPYALLTLNLALAPDVFAEPNTIHYIDPQFNDLAVYMSIDKERFNPDGWHLATESEYNERVAIEKQPELKALLDEFLPRWTEAYARALEQEQLAKDAAVAFP